ncbi:MAG: hypothetical protein HVN35_00010 [Methanobacteriaceae archaeon]|nr:hypothetical protein [Methanobacteriaceae archaeon]
MEKISKKNTYDVRRNHRPHLDLGRTTNIPIPQKHQHIKGSTPIFAVSILIIILLFIFALPALLGVIIDGAYGLFPVLTIIGVLVSFIFWLAVPTIFIFANQSIVVGEKSIIGSLKESFRLLRENIADVIVVLIINLVLLICVMALLGFINLILSIIPILGSILGIILNIIVYTLLYPYFALVLTYVYMDKNEIIYSDPENFD